MFMPGVLILWSKKKNIIITIAQIYHYDPQSTGINLQSPQSDSTPWTLTLAYFILKFKKNLAFCYDFEFAASRNLETVLYERNLSWRSDLVRPVFGLFTFTNWIRRYQIILQAFPQSATRFLFLISCDLKFKIQKHLQKCQTCLHIVCRMLLSSVKERKKDISLPDMRNFFNWQTMQLCGHPPLNSRRWP